MIEVKLGFVAADAVARLVVRAQDDRLSRRTALRNMKLSSQGTKGVGKALREESCTPASLGRAVDCDLSHRHSVDGLAPSCRNRRTRLRRCSQPWSYRVC